MKRDKRDIFVIGKKVGMTQVYNESGVLLPVTVVAVCDGQVVSHKTDETDGYSAVVVGFATRDGKFSGKGALAGGYDKVKELRVEDVSLYALGSDLTIGEFAKGDVVDVVGTTKGKGFQGVMKRHGFGGGPASHGSMFHRRGGSYGQRQWPGHVFKGRKMPGHDGDVSRTVQNLEVVSVHTDERLLAIKGSFPGSKNSYVVIRRAKKLK